MAVIWVIANTRTRSKNSSVQVTRFSVACGGVTSTLCHKNLVARGAPGLADFRRAAPRAIGQTAAAWVLPGVRDARLERGRPGRAGGHRGGRPVGRPGRVRTGLVD